MKAVRLNVQVPEDLAREINRLAGQRKRNQFLVDAIRRRVEEIRKEELARQLIEGYTARREEDIAMAREFEAVDLEGWDDY
jgi:metal-responsive CopG/Arc/MetJ family transcriptional regulator